MTSVSSKYDSRLLTILVSCFSELLTSACGDDKSWKKLCEGIDRHRLLAFTIEVQRKKELPEIDPDRLESDGHYRRQISRLLAKPLAPNFQTGVIPLERDRLSEPEYLRKMAGILGYRWQQKMATERANEFDKIVLLRTDALSIAECLDKMYLYQSVASSVSARIMKRFAFEEMDRDPHVQKVFSGFNEKCDEIEARYNQEVDERLARIKEDTARQLSEVMERIRNRSVLSLVCEVEGK